MPTFEKCANIQVNGSSLVADYGGAATSWINLYEDHVFQLLNTIAETRTGTDLLAAIATKLLGNAKRWQFIYAL